jgi:hypothetical protein
MTGINTAGYSGSGSRAAKFGYRYAAADSLWQQEVALKLGARYRSGGWYAHLELMFLHSENADGCNNA